MKCPIDGNPLQIAERQGVEIDYCPECRGVWLDRGELDKIIDRSAPQAAAPTTQGDMDGGFGHDGGRPRRKKKESFLSELFDF
jgi:hypothetical protein